MTGCISLMIHVFVFNNGMMIDRRFGPYCLYKISLALSSNSVTLTQSRNRPVVALRVLGGLDSQIFMKFGT